MRTEALVRDAPGVFRRVLGDREIDNFPLVNITHPDFDRHPQFRDAHVMTIDVPAGSALLLPAYWYHQASRRARLHMSIRLGASLGVYIIAGREILELRKAPLAPSTMWQFSARGLRRSLQSLGLPGVRERAGMSHHTTSIGRPRLTHGLVCRGTHFPPRSCSSLAHDLSRLPCGSRDPVPASRCSPTLQSPSVGVQVESFTDGPDSMNVAINFWFQGHSLATRLYRTLRENVFINCTMPAPEGALHPCRDSVLPPRPPPSS